ncbi:MAG: alpha/beta fold hydrolase [Spirochaetota bacterium]
MKLFSKEYGKGYPVIILHGLLGSSDNWHPIAKRLENRFRVITVDLRNHGRSPHAEVFNYEIMARDIADLLDEKQVSASHFIGHSLGGKVAMEVSLTYPKRIGKLIIVDINPKTYQPYYENIFETVKNLNLDCITSRKEAEEKFIPSVPDRLVRLFLLKNLYRDSQGKYKWKININGLAKNYDNIWVGIKEDSRVPYSGPVLFIRGALSDAIRDQDILHIQKLFLKAQIVTVPDAGHWIHATHPDTFTRIVFDFFKPAK